MDEAGKTSWTGESWKRAVLSVPNVALSVAFQGEGMYAPYMMCLSWACAVPASGDSRMVEVEGEATLEESRRCGRSSRNVRAWLRLVVGERSVPDTRRKEGACHVNTCFS